MSAPGPEIRFAAIGLDHVHIHQQVAGLLRVGATCVGYWSRDDARPLPGFQRKFPDLARVDHPERLYQDPSIQLVVTAGIPSERAGIAIRAMRHGKDVMTDKPGVVNQGQLAEVKRVQAETGRIWSVNFSERFEVRALTRAAELIQDGAIGRVVQTIGLGPHLLNPPSRPAWFFDPAENGSILVDIGSHQIDQFLAFTGSTEVTIATSSVGNYANPDHPSLMDFGEILLHGDRGNGYLRVDWYTPDKLGVFGDGRLLILGTEGYLEIRKYVDLASRPGGEHLFLVRNGAPPVYEACAGSGRPYYEQLCTDILERTETACPQAHTFRVFEIGLAAEANAKHLR
jgi:predicted dehydrogenase